MSCIRFSTSAQRAALAADGALGLTASDAALLHLAPPVTDSKLRRLRLLAEHSNPGIRESVASSRHAPQEVLAALAVDREERVRAAVARNECTPADVLRTLARDTAEQVRGWVALNYSAPADLLPILSADSSRTVRGLASWKHPRDSVD